MAGLAALHLAGLIGLLGVVAALLVVAASWWTANLGQRLRRVPGLAGTLVAAAAAFAVVDLVWLADTALDGFVHLLVLLILARLGGLRGTRDVRVVSYLSFFMLVAASASSLGAGFFFLFIAVVALGTWVLLLQHVAAETEGGRHRAVVGPAAGTLSGRALIGLGCVAALSALALAMALFFVIPRVGQAALPLRMRIGPLVTGFSDRVELGARGTIEADATVVMRVHVSISSGDPRLLWDLRWRGIVFDHFDGHVWTVGSARRSDLRRFPPGEFRIGVPGGGGVVLVQEVYLEPLGTDVVFAAPRLLRLDARTNQVAMDDMGSVSIAAPAARLHYTAVSEVGERRANPPGAPAELLSEAERARYLQLPPLPSRIADLARRVAAGTRDPYEISRRLTDFLSREFEYTLTLSRTTTLNPLDEFLFVRRAGHCEYFAAALAVMLRSIGIPARVVGGFQRGDWNEYGRYFMVRMRDAHAWVEAHVEGRGWITLDPSPRAAAELRRSALGLYLDAVRMRWYRYVINWSLRDQIETALMIRQQARAWRPSLGIAAGWDVPRPGGMLLLAAGTGLAVLAWSVGRRRPTPTSPRRGPLPPYYARALGALARRGLRPLAGETAREFRDRVTRAAPPAGPALARLTDAYERSRFGGRPAAPAEAAELNELARALARGRRQPVAPGP